jgi:serine O-acetyltransferase
MFNRNISVKEKFNCDVKRYIEDFKIGSPWKLIFIVDFYPVFLLRLEELTLHVYTPFKYLLNIFILFLRPFVNGMAGTRISRGAQVGGGLLLHRSVGVGIAAKAIIGENCTIYAGAYVANKANGLSAGAPVIGNNVQLMTGCKVVGGVTIGDNVIVGANAVVLTDIPEDSIAVGVPAVVKRKRK